MRRLLILLFLICGILSNLSAQNANGPIGQWREQYNNKTIVHVIKGDKIYGASNNQVFSIDSKKNIDLLGKSNGLNELGIAALAWDDLHHQLIIAYNNSNIDIVQGDKIYNLNDIVLSNLYANKKINDIKIFNQWALIATNFGIVVIDLVKQEIKDTWFPNNSRQSIITYQTTYTQDSLYAITEDGVYSAAIKNNWVTSNTWSTTSTYKNLGLNKLSSNGTQVAVYNKRNMYILPSTLPITTKVDGDIQQVTIAKDGSILLAIDYATKGAILKLNTDKTTTPLIDSTLLLHPIELLIDQNDYWVADSSNGLLLKNTASQWITIIGPSAKINGKSFINETGLIAPFNGNENGFATYNSNGWKNFTKNNAVNLPICIASVIDPKDQTYWLTSKNTLLHLNPSSASIELATPSSILGNFNDIQFGSDGNLWLLQDQQGLLKKNNATWNVYAPPKNFMNNGLNNMLVSKQGQVWMIAPPYQGLYVYQSNQVYATELWKQLTTSKSNGNLPSNNVTSLLEDKEGAIWVGTDNGIGIFNCGDISKEICDANLPFITNTNGFVGLLFQKERINCMAVDGANRKWIGTNNGTWLLSADGRDIITHFTKNNSPLPNDTVVQILIDPNEGEVFFNTASEMVSYRGNATDGAIAQKDLFIYPNPVGPNYNGPIAIRHLVENAIVKITELNGRLVFETRALGGQAIWDGKTYEGKKVATGIYLVFVRDDAGNEKVVGKILITSGQ